ncbi:MAG: RlmE family RNA methyltransferase [Chloroflexota bacterium]|nr:RlmE family RNA methyltransferase [Chloroflexota bacterium]
MSKWVQKRQRDHYFRKAKREGYRSRAAYKLKQINERYHLIHRGDLVVDMGCAPGSWSQVAAELTSSEGKVVGIDLQPVNPIPDVTILQGDMLDSEDVTALERALGGRQPNVVLSDMSPRITGRHLRDHFQSIALAEAAFDFARSRLLQEGNIVVKVFEGEDLPEFLRRVEAVFRFCKPHTPPASRRESSEIYVIGRGFYGS